MVAGHRSGTGVDTWAVGSDRLLASQELQVCYLLIYSQTGVGMLLLKQIALQTSEFKTIF